MRKLLVQPPLRIRHPAVGQQDRVPESLAEGTPEPLRTELEGLLGRDRVRSRLTDLVRYASDASPYRLVPQVVVQPRTVDEVACVLRYCNNHSRHATFRAGGTSLCGQAQGDDVIIDVREHWTGMKVEGDTIRVRPGTILAHANVVLARHGRQLGPDPASASAACMGGVLANNAAGMRCSFERSAYATLRHATLVLPNGAVVNTEESGAEEEFARVAPDLAAGLARIRQEILEDPELESRVRQQSLIRNTTGYAMRAFLDSDTPLGIFKHLVVGSEGTLAFIAEAVLETFPLPKVVGLCWLHAPSLDVAVDLVPAVRDLGATAVELVQGTSISSFARKLDNPPREWSTLPVGAASLLVEFGVDDFATLAGISRGIDGIVHGRELVHPVQMSTDPEFIALSWKLRSNMNADFALGRPKGSPIIQEDVCFPPARLADAVDRLSRLLDSHGYPPVVAGHAMFGNMHFSVTPDLGDQDSTTNYGRFMEALVALVVDDFGGSLKAEHGTGRNFAPFVERQWGRRATELMWQVRRLADPNRVLGRDVLLTGDPRLHMKRFRSEPPVEQVIDRCIECGLCEPVCPSRHVTTTPRQRIALRREMARQGSGSPVLERLLQEYRYDAVETCAADSSCSVACPYGIDTGAVMKEFRAEQATGLRERVALGFARRWGCVERIARNLMRVCSLVQRGVGHRPLTWVADAVRVVVSHDLMPTVPGPLPRAAKGVLPRTCRDEAVAVYFPACVNRIFGRDPSIQESRSLPEALVEVSRRAGRPVWIPDDVSGHCCGTIWSSKGYHKGRDFMYEKMARSVLAWTQNGRLPLLVDASSCTYGLVKELPQHVPQPLRATFSAVTILDATQWMAGLLDSLTVRRKVPEAVLHPGCSAAKLGIDKALGKVAAAVATRVHTPCGAGCCGTAGDRGLLHPELVVSATREEVGDLLSPSAVHLGSNRTCEMGLSQRTGRPYESAVFVLEEVTRP